MNKELKEQLEKDIKNLLGAIDICRDIKEFETKTIGKTSVMPEGVLIGIEKKNYSNYRKLIDTLRKLINTYKKVTDYKYQDEFYDFILTKLKNEIDVVHELYEKALSINEFEQYRCLIDVYDKLIDFTQDMERLRPHNKNINDDIIKITGNSNMCLKCEQKRNENNFYISHNTPNHRMNICRDCVCEITQKNGMDGLYEVLKTNDMPFIKNVYKSVYLRWDGNDSKWIPEYFKSIISLPQYREMRWKDSQFI